MDVYEDQPKSMLLSIVHEVRSMILGYALAAATPGQPIWRRKRERQHLVRSQPLEASGLFLTCKQLRTAALWVLQMERPYYIEFTHEDGCDIRIKHKYRKSLEFFRNFYVYLQPNYFIINLYSEHESGSKNIEEWSKCLASHIANVRSSKGGEEDARIHVNLLIDAAPLYHDKITGKHIPEESVQNRPRQVQFDQMASLNRIYVAFTPRFPNAAASWTTNDVDQFHTCRSRCQLLFLLAQYDAAVPMIKNIFEQTAPMVVLEIEKRAHWLPDGLQLYRRDEYNVTWKDTALREMGAMRFDPDKRPWEISHFVIQFKPFQQHVRVEDIWF